jgi:radical SAM superfamily enzyme YgiQ (UPF0313 family)
MPLFDPLQPSAQLGYLHSHVAHRFGGTIEVRSYSAHLDVLYRWKSEAMRETYFTHRLFGEELFLLACCHAHPAIFDSLYDAYLAWDLPECHASRQEIAELCAALRAYLRDRLAPALDPDRLNVIGFTTTFAQVYASIFAAREIAALTTASVIFVFGGASVTLPEVRAVLRRWGLKGLVVQGVGEQPLEKLLEACLGLDPCDSDHALKALDAQCIDNVSQIGVEASPINLALSREDMQATSDPNYEEFFLALRALCADGEVYSRLLKLVATPLEGSRGCFAKCDFCQNPFITAQFRTLPGTEVAARALRLRWTYGAGKIYFADSVCNTWAEAYADALLDDRERIDAFMEMRVHAPETFWTKLAISGVTEMQLGIEAVATPLLRAMNKGTTVWQNLRAAKYLQELGIRSSSNLITHHPKSTPADIASTREVLLVLDHLQPFSLSRFVISFASPIYQAIPPERRAELVTCYDWAPENLQPYTIVRDLAYPYPDNWLETEIDTGWTAFRRWYHDRVATNELRKPSLTVKRVGATRLVSDTRGESSTTCVLRGAEAVVLDYCHGAPVRNALPAALGLPVTVVDAALQNLIDKCLILVIDSHVLSLPLRPRSELLDGLTADRPASQSLAAKVEA